MERTVRVLNFTDGLAVSEAGIMLSAVTDYNEQRVTAAEQIIACVLAFFLYEESEGKVDIFSEWFFDDIYGDTCYFSVVMQASILWCIVQLL
jgi:hypothetical protein